MKIRFFFEAEKTISYPSIDFATCYASGSCDQTKLIKEKLGKEYKVECVGADEVN